MAGTTLIVGDAPARPRLTMSGSSLVVDLGIPNSGLCLVGFAEGATELTMQWGGAAPVATWTVSAP